MEVFFLCFLASIPPTTQICICVLLLNVKDCLATKVAR